MTTERYTVDELHGVAEEQINVLKVAGTPQDGINYLMRRWVRTHVKQEHITQFNGERLWLALKMSGLVDDQMIDW